MHFRICLVMIIFFKSLICSYSKWFEDIYGQGNEVTPVTVRLFCADVRCPIQQAPL